jgi:hypothetical protein
MKYGFSIAALLCAALSAASAQVASHAPTAMHSMTGTTSAASNAEVSGASLQVSGKPVVRINGAVLTDRDLLREMYAIFPYARVHSGFPKSQEADIRRGALEMIEYEELVYQEAERRKMVIPVARINRAEAAYRAKFPSDEVFHEYLKTEMGGSLALLRKQIRRSLLIEALLKLEVGAKSKVSLAEARAYYDKNPTPFLHPELFAIQTISIMPPDGSSPEVKQKARSQAEDAVKQAKATKSYDEFGKLAEKISEDEYRVNMGDHKSVEADKLKLNPEMLAAAKAMKPGQVSDLIQTGGFYVCFRLNGHLPSGKATFAEVKDRLMKDMEKTKYDSLRATLDKKLRSQAKVEEL